MPADNTNYYIKFVNQLIRLHSTDVRALELFDLLFHDMRFVVKSSADDGTSAQQDEILQNIICHIDISRTDDGKNGKTWLMKAERQFQSEYDEKYRHHKMQDDDQLCFHLLDAALYYFADYDNKGHMIHAAAVSKGQGCVILPGNSGAGKSTLMTWLIKQGFEYQTDEMIYLDENGTIEPFRRSIQIKNHGYDTIATVLGDEHMFKQENRQQGIVKGKSFAILPWHVINPNKAHPAPLLKAVLFPQYQAKAAFSLQQISPAKASMQLMGCHINARNLIDHGIKDVAGLFRVIPAYHLTYNHFEQLEDTLLPLLNELI